jgi:Family of unknown function (DUF5996)
MPTRDDPWPAIDYPADKDTLEALHMQSQVVGKVKLALATRAPEWQQVPLWVNARGLTTGLLPADDIGIEIAFDLANHRLRIETTEGRSEGFDLRPLPLRAFTAEVMDALGRLGVQVTINPMTVEVANPVRCDVHEGFDAYDPDAANRLFRVLSQTALVFERFRTGFWGKQTPVSFFWGSFDLATVRYNLIPVPPAEGMGLINRIAMDSEQAEVGFWPGSARYERPAFFAYTFPKPEGLETAPIEPAPARWNPQLGEFILDYDDVRTTEDPGASILAFAHSTYAAGAGLAGWDRALLERTGN